MNNDELSIAEALLAFAVTTLFVGIAIYYGILKPGLTARTEHKKGRDALLEHALDAIENGGIRPITHISKGGTPMNNQHYPRPTYQTSITVIEEIDDRDTLNDTLAMYHGDESLTAILGTMTTEADVERALLDEGYSPEDIQRDNRQGDIIVLWNPWFGYYVFVDKPVAPTLGSVVLAEDADMHADIKASFDKHPDWQFLGDFPSESAVLEELNAYGMTTPVVRYLSDPGVHAIHLSYHEDAGFAVYAHRNVLPETSRI